MIGHSMPAADALHVMFEGVAQGLLTESQVCRFLTECVPLIGMIPIEGALLVYEGQSGWGGLQGIATSHISVHSKGTAVWGDIFSCERFDITLAMEFAGETLGLLEVRVRELLRASPILSEAAVTPWSSRFRYAG